MFGRFPHPALVALAVAGALAVWSVERAPIQVYRALALQQVNF